MAVTDQNLFSEHVYSSSFQEEFRKHWNSPDGFKSPKFEIISSPFKICRIPNFLKNVEFLENLKSELTKHDFNYLRTDLYQFQRTDDLVNMRGDYIPTLYKSFQSTLTSWMECNTDIKLNGKISMSSARYQNTHHLLCHDDNMGDRRIAYILYLSKDWTEQDGGTLDLFDMDQHGAPGKVGEVTADAKSRWSINGWFHGPIRNDLHKQPRYEIPKNLLEPSVKEVELTSWITERYLLPKITKQIQRNVEKTSYAFIEDFLKQSTYQKIANDVTSQDINWQMMGPADMRHYEVADEKTLPESLKALCDLFKSISFFRLLKKYTGLDLVPEDTAANSNVRSPKMRLELQRWSAGCYTLLYDKTMLEDATDEIDANSSDESIKADSRFLLRTAQLDDTAVSTSSSTKNKIIGGATQEQLKRKRTESSSSGENASGEKKIAKHLDGSFDVDQKSPTGEKTESVSGTSTSPATKTDRLESASATGSSLHKSEAISCDAKIDITTDIVSDSEEGTLVLCDDNLSSNDEDSISTRDGYALDVMIQFHTVNAQGTPKTEDTIDYVNPCEEQGSIIEVPQKDNYLCLAYKSPMVCRLQRYLNHFYDGYTYNLLCMYYE
ncbi:prolyl 3-hydroxylase OGFOD1 isoform X2 [Ooceraea biroi]|uniref:prolyl 3-hydroxylase OGFOD1 isoform X2 n=1 Tax=Ooceraea biroi TaxID=2015173 RepID=UPI0005B971BD|nr:prolyl 3-hydroxylase OGFOD1 isoform X2 [Ooceraea biroi]